MGRANTLTILVIVMFLTAIQIWKMGQVERLYQTKHQLEILAGELHAKIEIENTTSIVEEDTVEKTIDQATAAVAPTNLDEFANLEIRSWGCDLTETPLIFVHNGKSGGGNIRARLAAAAKNFTRKKYQHPNHDNHYYPIQDNTIPNETVYRRGKYCHSLIPHYAEMPHIAKKLVSKTFEGLQKCNATTPLGIALACPHPYKSSRGMGSGQSGLQYKHYQDINCGACDDDYYLQPEFYFPDSTNINIYTNHNHTLRRQLADKVDNFKQRKRRKRRKKNKAGSNERTLVIDSIPPFSTDVLDPALDLPPGSTCDTVLAAHNNLGAELHWLPPRYLKYHWWDNMAIDTTISMANKELLEPYWNKLLDDRHRRRAILQRLSKGIKNDDNNDDDKSQRWCPTGYISDDDQMKYDRPSSSSEYKRAYEACSRPLAQRADQAFAKEFPDANFSPFYASMPLHRVTVMRDPWAWIISKFFWHGLDSKISWKYPSNFVPDDIIGLEDPSWLPCYNVLTLVPSKGSKTDSETDIPTDPLQPERFLGWCEQFSLNYLIKLCGDDCLIRYQNGMMDLEQIEAQVNSNLRQSFSVVGLLQQQDEFYDMITDRIQYLNMSLNIEVSGKDHATPKTDINLACKHLFAHNETFREMVRHQVPAFAALERMYHLGIQVNAFQKEELKQCKLAKGEQPTKGVYE